MYELVEERQKESSGIYDQSVLLKINKYLEKNTLILLLTVNDEADAYAIFETLNDRGRGLTTMDLIKNYIFGHAKSQLEQAKISWAILRDNLNGIESSERFLHHYWTSIHGRTSKSKLFRLMRDEISTAKTAMDFVKKLAEASKIYSALIAPHSSYLPEYESTTISNLEVLNMLDAQQTLPILLAASYKFDKNEMRKLTTMFVVMAVRYNLIGELRTGVSANYYSDIPPRIHSGELSKAAKIFREIKTIYPKDEDFRDAFKRKVIRDSKKARYILSEIEKYINNGVSEIVDDVKNVNLEHILPKNPSGAWSSFTRGLDKEEIQEYTYRIGNLALTSSVNNKLSGSKDFSVKKDTLFKKEDKISTTLMVADYTEWNTDSINDRQEKLADYAVKIWRVDID